MNEFVYYYRVKEDKTITLLRVYGNNPIVEIPSLIDGKIVSEIGAYCFSKANRLKEYKKTSEDISYLFELSGENVEGVILPDTIKQINSYAFYNCRKCKEIQLHSNVTEIGSDVFLNCLSLHTIRFSGRYKQMTVLKLLLKQISWDIDICFDDVVLLFPEYYENYNVIGPAHIFGMNISGEGYRARQCFKNNVFMIHEYDNIFEKLCIEESVKTLCHFALNRLLFPTSLSENHYNQYQSYIMKHSLDACLLILLNEDLLNQKKILYLEKIIRKKLIDEITVNSLIEIASNKQMVEISTKLIQWKKECYATRKKYEFEDF